MAFTEQTVTMVPRPAATMVGDAARVLCTALRKVRLSDANHCSSVTNVPFWAVANAVTTSRFTTSPSSSGSVNEPCVSEHGKFFGILELDQPPAGLESPLPARNAPGGSVDWLLRTTGRAGLTTSLGLPDRDWVRESVKRSASCPFGRCSGVIGLAERAGGVLGQGRAWTGEFAGGSGGGLGDDA
jgi:hypothetical protein